jgi:beta-glucanase (GH16 family)
MTVYKEVKNILYNMKWLTFILLFTMSAFALGESLLLTVTVPTGTDAVRLTGPEWKWNPIGGPEATDNGDGTWSVTLDPAPTDNMEYLWVVDDVQENLIDIAATNAKCSLNTDFWSYANRVVPKGSGNAANTYNSCYPTAPVPTDAANSVLSVFSTKYGNLVNTNFNPYWGQSTEVHSTGDNLVYTNLNYQGTSFDSPLNLSPYIYLNIDYYVVQSTSLNFFLISPGDGKETSVALNVSTPNQWVNVKIPLNESYSAVVDLAKVIQFKVDGNGQVAFNNLYFGGSVSDIKGCTDSNAYNYNSEATKSDDSCIFYVSVTFKVNMTGQDTSDGVSVVGGNHFGKEGVVMTGPNGDGIWTVEAQLPPNTTVNFKYRATTESTWDSQETVPANCGFGEWRDRQVNVGVANKTLNVTYFSSCDDKPPVLNPITYWPLSENFLSVEAFCEDDDCNVAVGMTRNGDFGVYYLKTYNDISTNSPSQGYVTINYSERNVEAYDRLKITMKKGLWHNSNIPVHVKLEQKGCVNSAEVSLIDGCQMIPIDRLKGTTNLTDEIGRNGNCNIDLSTGVNVTFIMGEYNKTDSLNYDFEISSVEFTTTKDICTYGCTDPAADNYNPAVDMDNGNCTYTYITITTTVCGTASNVRMTGPWWGWGLSEGPEAEGPEATDNGDGKWTFKMIAPKLDMEYLLVVDGKLEHFTVDDDCVTNSTTRENSTSREWKVGSGNVTNTYDTCGNCQDFTYGCTDTDADNYNDTADIDNGNCTYTYITITTTVCGTASNVRMTGPWWGWKPNGGPEATDNGDGKWTFKMIAPKLDMEYLLVVDGKLEQFTVDDDCVTNSTSREWKVGSGNVTNTYDTCGNCQDFTYGCTDTAADNYNDTVDIDNGNCTYTYITITTTVCGTASDCGTASNVRMTGPWWGWKPNGGPEATDNGDGKWTFNMTAPKEDMEYLLVVDGILEQFTAVDYCAPGSLSVTNSTSREWKVGSGNVTNTYDTCGNCQDFRIKQEDFRIKQEDFRIKQGIKELFFNPPLDDKWHLQKECITDDGNCWANDEKQHYTDRSDNAYVSGGHLHIVAKKEQYVYQNVTKSYTSARLNSKYDFKYGTVKVRAKLPKQKGLWPAIWTLGSNINEVGVHDFGRSPEVAWPSCGEIDIMEQYGTGDFVGAAMHGPSYEVITTAAGGNGNQIPWDTEVVVDEFHVYSMEWTAEKIIFKVDEVVYKTVTAPSVTTNWPFNHEHFLLLNVAVEPERTGGIENFESGEMVVDYVRIYGENGELNWSDEFGLGWSDEFISYLESVPKSILKEAYNSRSGC